MDKESLILLQEIDCCCNDCIFMMRDTEKYLKSLEAHHRWQLDYFNTIKNKLLQKAKQYKDMYYDLERWDKLCTQAEALKFQFNRNEALINYGICTNKAKNVSFIPNTCSLENQKCFKHRRSVNQ